MAKRRIEAEVAITATDDASATLQRLENRIDGLEADEARITVSANVDKLEGQRPDHEGVKRRSANPDRER